MNIPFSFSPINISNDDREHFFGYSMMKGYRRSGLNKQNNVIPKAYIYFN